MSNNIHDMALREAALEYERQLAAKDARIAALEAALQMVVSELCEEGNRLSFSEMPIPIYVDVLINTARQALGSTHTAKSE